MAKTVAELNGERIKLVDAASAILDKAKADGGRDLTAEEATEFDGLSAKIDENKKLAAAAAKNDERAALIANERALASQSAGRQADANPIVHRDAQGREVGRYEQTDEEITFQVGEAPDAIQRQSYKQQKKQNRKVLKSSGYKPWGEFKSCRDFIRSGLEGHTQSHFRDRALRHFAAVQGMSEGIGSDGGYLVMPEFGDGIIDRVYSNPLWAKTDNYNVVGNNMTFLANAETSRANGSRHGGLRGYWIPEGGAITKSKPTLRPVTLKLVKLGVVVYLTQELLDDGGSALEQYVGRKASEEFQFMIGDGLINGTGVGQPLGVLNAPSLVSVAKESGQGAATIQTENVEKMYARFYAPNIGGLEWYHNQDIIPQLNTMTLGIGAAGVPTYLPPGGVSAAPFGTLKGRPLQPLEFCSTLGTQGDLIAADMGQMISISKGGVAQAVSMHVEFLTDQLALRFVMRLNATPWENAALTPYKGTNTQSSFVTLDTRA